MSLSDDQFSNLCWSYWYLDEKPRWRDIVLEDKDTLKKDWVRVHNTASVLLRIEAVDPERRRAYCSDVDNERNDHEDQAEARA